MSSKLAFLLFFCIMGCFVYASSENENNHCGKNNELDFDCGEGELRTRCISSFWQCDNVYDCTTGKDEIACKYLHKCPVGYFTCRNGDCFLANVRCNGKFECLDESDERGCALPKDNASIVVSSQHASASVRTRPPSAHPSTANESNKGNNNPGNSIETNGLSMDNGIGHRAEAIIDVKPSEDDEDESSGVFPILIIITLLLVLLTLLGLIYIRRQEYTKVQFDEALRDFQRSVSSSARSVGVSAKNFMSGCNISPQRPASTSASSSSANNGSVFFENPMNTLQVPTTIASNNSMSPLIV